jgi:putative YhbY family RNA-binding protein
MNTSSRTAGRSAPTGDAPDEPSALPEAHLPDGFKPGAPPAPTLDSAQRSALRAQAHGLSPVVIVSESGLTANLIVETDRALGAHGLIKVRVFGDDREARAEVGRRLCDLLGCAPVQAIGKLLVLWRPPLPSEAPRKPVQRRKPQPTKRQAAEGKTVGTQKKSRKSPAVPPAQPSVGRPAGRGLRSGFAGASSASSASADRFGRGNAAPGPTERAARPTTRGKPSAGAGKSRQAASRIARGAVNPAARPRSAKPRSGR